MKLSEWVEVYVTRNKAVVTFLISVVVLGLALIVLSFCFPNAKGPAQWLIDWTAWGTKYVALVVATGGIVKVANSLSSRLKHGIVPLETYGKEPTVNNGT